jgi:hypothetical protein
MELVFLWNLVSGPKLPYTKGVFFQTVYFDINAYNKESYELNGVDILQFFVQM